MKEDQKEGWGFPWNSRKAHYFINGRSLCNRWLYTGALEQGNDDSPDNCAICKRKLKKRREGGVSTAAPDQVRRPNIRFAPIYEGTLGYARKKKELLGG